MLGLFTQEAAIKGLTGTLQRTGLAGQSIGSGLSGIGTGIGGIFKGLLTPLWEVGNFAKSFGFGSPNISGQGYSTNDPQAIQERTLLSGQGGGFDDASQQGGGDVGINEDPVGDQPNWFNFDPFPQAYGMFDVGGSNIRTSTISWGNGTIAQGIPLSQEARDYYSNIGVSVDTGIRGGGNEPSVAGGGGGSNTSSGGGGGFGSTPSTSIGSGSFGSKPASGGWGL